MAPKNIRPDRVHRTSQNPDYNISERSEPRFVRGAEGQRRAPLSQLNTSVGRSLSCCDPPAHCCIAYMKDADRSQSTSGSSASTDRYRALVLHQFRVEKRRSNNKQYRTVPDLPPLMTVRSNQNSKRLPQKLNRSWKSSQDDSFKTLESKKDDLQTTSRYDHPFIFGINAPEPVISYKESSIAFQPSQESLTPTRADLTPGNRRNLRPSGFKLLPITQVHNTSTCQPQQLIETIHQPPLKPVISHTSLRTPQNDGNVSNDTSAIVRPAPINRTFSGILRSIAEGKESNRPSTGLRRRSSVLKRPSWSSRKDSV
ncbi:hypothetical protein B0J11DRAFT_501160 [Dendryphion nanum]|uniref:Uncharacterized protein n=1 Tax=Dendryphion nanum TaxID=256645 RepID=A0A9P9J0L1_9PLEO|nr:hypothetical protein B0J11DRAFT_501160 [Dendryphion nanum]